MARKDSSSGPYVRKEQSGLSTHGSKRFYLWPECTKGPKWTSTHGSKRFKLWSLHTPWIEQIIALVLTYVRNKVDVAPMARKDSSCGPYVRKEQSGRSIHGSKRF